MAEEAKGVSEEVVEARSYTQIKESLESSDDAKGSTTPATQAPAPGATQAPQPAPSQLAVEEPKTLDEAKALLAKQQKQIDDSQSQIGKQGNEMGSLREMVAKLQGTVDAGVKPAPLDEDANKPYAERFKGMKSLEKVSDDNKEFLGTMFDVLKADILKGSGGGGEQVTRLQEQVQLLQDQQTKQYWAAESTELATKHGKLFTDNRDAIAEDMERQMKAGQMPSVTETFKRLTYDQALQQTQQPKPKGPKAILNAEASLQPNSTQQERPAVPVTHSGMTSVEKVKAIAADRIKRGLEP